MTSPNATAFIYVRDDIYDARGSTPQERWARTADDHQVGIPGDVSMRVGSQYRFYPVCNGRPVENRLVRRRVPPGDPVVVTC